ncbi:MAG: T9SS type A sorting domain-containing protein [Candidatus Eisenbacteria bacterium]|nr:T9SS type A sorting domain-containing protein [Candidatus Eisenbacteria bacterium]
MKATMILMALVGLLVTPFATSHADFTLWHSPTVAWTNNSQLTIEPSLPGTGLHVTTTSPGDHQWVTIGLTLPSNVTIEGVHVCYELASPQSFISQVRLTRMVFPNTATVIHDDPTDLTDPGPTCYLSPVYSEAVESTISLSFRLYFDSVDDWVDIGAIGIVVRPVVSDVDDDPVADDLIGLQLRPNQPNPFGSETMIEYALSENDQVELQILDVSGRAVRTLLAAEQPMGQYRVIWDGRNDAGLEMPAGTYYYRVRIGEQEGSRGMVMVR